jgi:hypothetical protein
METGRGAGGGLFVMTGFPEGLRMMPAAGFRRGFRRRRASEERFAAWRVELRAERPSRASIHACRAD